MQKKPGTYWYQTRQNEEEEKETLTLSASSSSAISAMYLSHMPCASNPRSRFQHALSARRLKVVSVADSWCSSGASVFDEIHRGL